jgi:hypothetical protein
VISFQPEEITKKLFRRECLLALNAASLDAAPASYGKTIVPR